MSSPTNHRDDELGAALRELEVPGHRPSFQAELHGRLADERLARAAARALARAAARGRPTRARRTRLWWGLRVAAVAAVVGIVLAAIGIPRTERTPRIGPDVATAAEIKARVQAALANMRNLSGTLVSDGPQRGDARRFRFTLTAEGDFRLVGPTADEIVTYNASAGVTRSIQRSASAGGDSLFYAVRRGVAPGRPDLGPPTWIIPDQFGAFVRALLAAEDPRVEEIVYQGRPAWRLDIDVVPNAIVPDSSADHLEITVDRETGIPVRVLETNDGAFWRETRIEDLAVNGDLPPNTFRLEFPAGAEVMQSDDGFRRVELAEVAGIVGYEPFVPAWVPDGYELAEVAVAREAAATGSEAANPPSRMVVSLSYRRGLDHFVVTTRLARVPAEGEPEVPPAQLWGDPLASGEGIRDEREQLSIRQGALEGEAAELVVSPHGIPHVWVLTDDLVLTVGGDLSRAELVEVTESLTRE
jgi:outer membrane lipoprotein-sorting protein